jgi:hypothetical protein
MMCSHHCDPLLAWGLWVLPATTRTPMMGWSMTMADDNDDTRCAHQGPNQETLMSLGL